MTTTDTTYYDECPVCHTKFIGAHTGDMIAHFIEEHPDLGDRIASFIDLSKKRSLECNNCGREYMTYMGECPWCRHGGPPYK